MTIYRRGESEWWEDAAAAATAVAIGLASFYLLRIWLQREPLDEGEWKGGAPRTPARRPGGTVEEEPGRRRPGEPRESSS
ncbi:MAG: hypothetical protein ACE5JR_04975 [Gemmatimonadota bacterium]